MQIVLFEDDRVEQLAPIAAAEPAFAVTCGGYKLAQLVRGLGPVCSVVRPHLTAIETETYPDRTCPAKPLDGPVLFVNARIAPAISAIQRLKELADAGSPGIVSIGEHVAAALVARGPVELSRKDTTTSVTARLKSLKLPRLKSELPLIDHPHDLVRYHLASCRENFEHRLKSGYREVHNGVFVGENATLGPHLVTDTTKGPVLIDHDATIGPFCFLRGPVYIGPKCRVIEHASIKDNVSLGHTTKVGGEVEGSIIEPYSNKQHHGYLGHAYVGSWVNLGAGTSNSDLKNTYGNVSMNYGGQKVPTGMQFVGCFVGDYVKTAINTSIFTGKRIGVCSLVYGFVTADVPAFCNYAQSFGQVTDLPADVMIAVQQRMFARRGVAQRPCDIQLIRDLYAQARREQKLPNEPLTL